MNPVAERMSGDYETPILVEPIGGPIPDPPSDGEAVTEGGGGNG